MENLMKTFESQEFGKVRVVEISGEPWLVGKDIAKALGYSNGRDAISKHVDDDDKGGRERRHPWWKAGFTGYQ